MKIGTQFLDESRIQRGILAREIDLTNDRAAVGRDDRALAGGNKMKGKAEEQDRKIDTNYNF